VVASLGFGDLKRDTLVVLEYTLQIQFNGLGNIESRFEFKVQVTHIDGRDVHLLSNLLQTFIRILSKQSAFSITISELFTVLNPPTKVSNFIS